MRWNNQVFNVGNYLDNLSVVGPTGCENLQDVCFLRDIPYFAPELFCGAPRTLAK